MSVLLLLDPDPHTRAFLVDALSPTYRLVIVQSWSDLERSLRIGTHLGCILDVFNLDQASTLPSIRRLRRNHPGPALIACSDFTGRQMDLYHLGRMNVDGVIRLEEELSPRRVREVVDRAMLAALASLVLRKTAKDLPSLIQEGIRWAIERAGARPQVSDLAAALGVSPRTLNRATREAGVAPPSSLLLWGRLIQASYFLVRSDETVESVAYRLEYSTAGALRKALKRHVGCSPTSLVQQGGLALTLDMFKHNGLGRDRHEKTRWATARSPRWRTATKSSRPS